MTPAAFSRSPLIGSEAGFGLIEVMIAVLVMAVGVLALIGSFNSARKLTLLSERRTAQAHTAQLELERLQTYPYSELAMISKAAHSSEKTNPDYYVNYASPVKCTVEPCFAWNASSTGEEESLVTAAKEVDCTVKEEAGCGLVATSPTGRKCSGKLGACEWSNGGVEGSVYDFVTWHTDGKCGGSCPAAENYKRLTVVVTVKVPAGNHEPAPYRVSTLVAKSG